jgi:hypothetical protein
MLHMFLTTTAAEVACADAEAELLGRTLSDARRLRESIANVATSASPCARNRQRVMAASRKQRPHSATERVDLIDVKEHCEVRGKPDASPR